MTHEPECDRALHPKDPDYWCNCDNIRAAYRRGYNDHARTVQHWQDTHGAYRAAPDDMHGGHCPQCRDRVDFHYLDDSRIWRCRYCPCDMQFTTTGFNP